MLHRRYSPVEANTMIRPLRFAPNPFTLLALLAATLFVAPVMAQDMAAPATAPAAADATPAVTTDATTAPAGTEPAAAPVAEAATAPAATEDLKDSVENFWHYGKIARYDLATAEGQKILAAGADPDTVLTTFETVAGDRHDDLDQWLLRWQGVDAMKDVTTQITKVVADGYRARRSSADFINTQI